MKKKKILTMTTTGLAKKEGISTVILDNYRLFDKNKFELDLIASGAYNYRLIEEFLDIGVNIRCLPSRKISLVQYVKALNKLMKQRRYDAVYLHGSSSILSIELVLAILHHVDIRVVHSHNTTCDYKRVDRLLRPLFYKCYTVALACGTEAGKWLYGGRPFDIIKNGRNIDVYKFDEEKRKQIRNGLGVSDSTILIGHVGNFNEQKNQKYLILVIHELLEINQNIHMYLMGDGRIKEELEKIVLSDGLSEKVTFTGSICNVPEMLQAMDVMVLPSLHEGLPLVVIEWQIAGLPCVISDMVTRECCYTDLVYFVSLRDPSEWAKRILEIAKIDRENKSHIAISATREQGFDLYENADKLQRYFLA